jgi:hypothetical protein
MPDKLNVLVLESERGAADGAREELTAAGHTVLRCHEPGAPAFPCNALAKGQECPLEGVVVDVALDVRSRPRPQPVPREDGVACALRHHIPVVVAGPEILNPYDGFAVGVLGRTYNVVDDCERAAHAPLRDHTAVATRTLREVLDRRGIRSSVVVAVRRRHGALAVEVVGAEKIDDATKSMASVRMSAALREVDRHARGIDVAFQDR